MLSHLRGTSCSIYPPASSRHSLKAAWGHRPPAHPTSLCSGQAGLREPTGGRQLGQQGAIGNATGKSLLPQGRGCGGIVPSLPCGGSIAGMIGSGLHGPRSVSSTFCCLGRERLALWSTWRRAAYSPGVGGLQERRGLYPQWLHGAAVLTTSCCPREKLIGRQVAFATDRGAFTPERELQPRGEGRHPDPWPTDPVG